MNSITSEKTYQIVQFEPLKVTETTELLEGVPSDLVRQMQLANLDLAYISYRRQLEALRNSEDPYQLLLEIREDIMQEIITKIEEYKTQLSVEFKE